MVVLRRRLASGALALTLLQFVVLCAAPMACCLPFQMKADATGLGKAAATNFENTDAAPAECPLHKSKESGTTSKTPDSHCRMMCDNSHGPHFPLGAIGVLASPRSAEVHVVSAALPAAAALIVTARPAVPDAPPPRLL